jgi:hypothetical protein
MRYRRESTVEADALSDAWRGEGEGKGNAAKPDAGGGLAILDRSLASFPVRNGVVLERGQL